MKLDLKSSQPSKIRYEHIQFKVLEINGGYVVCAQSGRRIGLEYLRYWDVETQQAYAGPYESLMAYYERNPEHKPTEEGLKKLEKQRDIWWKDDDVRKPQMRVLLQKG